MSYDFTFAGIELSSLHGVTTERPPHEVAEYDFELVDIPGRSGSEYIDNKRYKNVTMTRKIGLIQRSATAQDTIVENLIEWLAYSQGYQEFEDSDHPNMVTYAVLTNFAEVQTLLRRYHKATLKFSRVPFWYQKEGLEPTEIDLSETAPSISLTNPFKISSKPLIRVEVKDGATSGNQIIRFSVTTGGVLRYFNYTINRTIYSGTNYVLDIDCENATVRLYNSNTDNYISDDLPSEFSVGVSSISIPVSYVQYVKAMKIFPRWRCL